MFSRTAGALVIPAIPSRKVMVAKLLVGGENVTLKENTNLISLTISSKETIKGDLVVVLTMKELLDGLPTLSVEDFGSTFAIDKSTYGSVISRKASVKLSSTSPEMPTDGGINLLATNQTKPFAIKTNIEAAPFVEIDLGKSKKVTDVL